MWAETYDRYLRDIFEIQDEITEAIVGSMGSALNLAEAKRAIHKETPNLDAYDYRMRGMWHFLKFSKEDNRKARAFFEQAIELDPEYAGAFATLAATHFWDNLFQWTDSPAPPLDDAVPTVRPEARVSQPTDDHT